MINHIGARVLASYRSTTHFLRHDIWEKRLDELPSGRAHLYRAARIAQATLRSLVIEDTMHVRAAALTYFTVLSLVPLLAFGFALLKGFGAYEMLVEETIRPYVLGLLQGNEALTTAFEQILSFVGSTGVTSLGFVGLLTLLYAATRLLRNVERALNELWGLNTSRELLEQFRDYVLIIFVTPLCMMAAAALTTAGQAVDILQSAGETLGISGLLDWLIGILSPLIILFLGLVFLYKVLPYTHVRFASAAVGAGVGALLWYAVLIIHVRFQVGVAQYNALYSSFGAIPIFLAWLQISWLVILTGAHVAASHQNHRALAQRLRASEVSQAVRESASLAAAVCVARAFISCDPPPTLTQLSEELDLPETLLRTMLDQLVDAKLLARVASAGDPAFVLARPASLIHVKDVIDAAKHILGADGEGYEPPRRQGIIVASELWQELDRAAASSPANRTLSQVVEG